MMRATFVIVIAALIVMGLTVFSRQEPGQWTQAMEAIHWDRDTCAHCGMVISDPRFAVELRGGPSNTAFKFDDVGCLANWLRKKGDQYPWARTAPVWVADFNSVEGHRDTLRWLSARTARYIPRSSPMGSNLAAVQASSEPSIDFDEMLQWQHTGSAP